MLEKIDTRRWKQVASSLKWLAFSLRPLRLDDLAEIFILDHELPVPFDEKKRLFQQENVLNYLSGLVTTVPIRVPRRGSVWEDTEAIVIRLTHFSIKEYLMSQRMRQDLFARFSITETNAHLHISESCLAYHLHISKTELATEESVKRFALWEYAALHWERHLEEVARESWTTSVTSRAIQVLTPCAQSLLNMVRIRDPESYVEYSWDLEFEKLASPLYYTASFGAFRITCLLINRGANVNEQSHTVLYGNALQAAAFYGKENTVQLLLHEGADVNVQGGCFGNALQAAAYDGNKSIVQLLLDKGANINAHGGTFGNALQAAVVRDNLSVAQLLLSKGAKMDPPGARWEELLESIIKMGWVPHYIDRLRKFQENPTSLLLLERADSS